MPLRDRDYSATRYLLIHKTSHEPERLFQELVSLTLAYFPRIFFYIDDILIFASNVQEHDKRLDQVMQAIWEGFKSQYLQMHVCYNAIGFLGLVVSVDRDNPLSDTIKDFTNVLTPSCTKNIKELLGRVFNLISLHVKPSKDKSTIKPTAKNESIFCLCSQNWRSRLATTCTFTISDPNWQTFVSVNDDELCGLLPQIQGNKKVPITRIATVWENFDNKLERSSVLCMRHRARGEVPIRPSSHLFGPTSNHWIIC